MWCDVLPSQTAAAINHVRRELQRIVMKVATLQKPDHPTPSIAAALMFRSKATLLQIKRAFQEFTRNNVKQAPFGDRLIGHPIIAESRTPLRMTDDEVENLFISGKIHNLRLAIRKLNGLEVGAGDVFSFWTHLGRTSRWKEYVPGRELREGCLILTIGGGLCQLSNALYDAALQAGLQIVERHAHTRVIAGSLAEIGRDATVFWNYVDLRFKSNRRGASCICGASTSKTSRSGCAWRARNCLKSMWSGPVGRGC